MSFYAPFLASCLLIREGPMSVLDLSLHCRLSARSYWMRRQWPGSRNSADLQCMVGRPGPLGMMGRELAGRCTTGTCDRGRVA